jgi:hypothetical protein
MGERFKKLWQPGILCLLPRFGDCLHFLLGIIDLGLGGSALRTRVPWMMIPIKKNIW